MIKYLVWIETYLTGVRTIATCNTFEEAYKILDSYKFKQSPNPRECEVAGWIQESEGEGV